MGAVDEVTEYDLSMELLDEVARRGGHECVQSYMDLLDHDGILPLPCVMYAADSYDIPIPAHFEADVTRLVSEYELEQRDLIELRELMASQHARGL
ncbi:hypothetical protein [Cutibacterium sp.]|uniref:hypothetical protein n=1 Tax=Cutibacterium sp. TaxID=1912221 RepID=UPI0026DC327A|nr:hypothetical protein [Cutibacterium sp.]MDO4413061.1 hypothetical protein [Cutibacterium sp.]